MERGYSAVVVDIHNHILPGIDDGPKSMDEALLLVKNAEENGVTHIIATPHLNDKYCTNAQVIKEAIVELRRAIAKSNISIEVLLGQEIHFYKAMNVDKTNELVTLGDNGNYLLLELPNDHLPHYTFELLFRLLQKGYLPIIPHPERNVVLRKKKQKVYELVEKGAFIQVTASSVIGIDGYAAKRFTNDLIKHNLVHFIASDAHHHEEYPFLLVQAYQEVRKRFSERQSIYFIENAKHVKNGTALHTLPPIPFKKWKESY